MTEQGMQYPSVVELDADSVAGLLSVGYRLVLVNRRMARASHDGSFMFHARAKKEAGDFTATVVLKVEPDMSAGFKIFVDRPMSHEEFVSAYHAIGYFGDFGDTRASWLSEMREAGLADGNSRLEGNFLFMRGTGLHLFAALEILSRWSAIFSGADVQHEIKKGENGNGRQDERG